MPQIQERWGISGTPTVLQSFENGVIRLTANEVSERNVYICYRLQQGAKLTDIGREVGLSVQRIRQIGQDKGILPKRIRDLDLDRCPMCLLSEAIHPQPPLTNMWGCPWEVYQALMFMSYDPRREVA